MILKRKQEVNTSIGILFFILFYPGVIFGQCQNGKVVCSKTNKGIGYASIGIIGKNVGTVSDQDGSFTLTIDDVYNNDSLRFSMIGYEPRCILVSQFKENLLKNISLDPKSYALQEVKVIYQKPKKVRLGTPVLTTDLRSGFDSNILGSELGIELDVRKRVKLKDINLNIAVCTYDSVTYRLNIYQSENGCGYNNILTEPIYISFTKDDINEALTFDLADYSIIVEGNIMVALELYKDLGEGKLLFQTQFFTGNTLHRKTSEGNWTQSPGAIGMYLTSHEIR